MFYSENASQFYNYSVLLLLHFVHLVPIYMNIYIYIYFVLLFF